MDLMSEKVVNLSRKMQTIEKNQMEISELKTTKSEVKILRNWRWETAKELVNL